LFLRKLLLPVDHELMCQLSPGRQGNHRVSGLVEIQPTWPRPLGCFYFS
jgi:hypothetical protein